MKLDYSSEKYITWVTLRSIYFERKLENETAFDGIVKIYSVKTNDLSLNETLKGKYFGSFFFPTESGFFLRMFNSKNSWPKTTLVYLNLKDLNLVKIDTNRSSWNLWTGVNLGNGKYSINISPSKSLEYIVIAET
ncbi:hypothetical protein [Flavobacterium subsaxonicum]|uniref:Uncharacterized protein n=1 Tax=Flavobacterium subsaxonicum WB 4.1-42 = DSM 21790 TaxID=1121898 RepID=A0A0A2MLK3_9FLAO|nr:hypothetical protein [Flavobacterium subsaxonicum]KGO93542.1 hypothetical protein Q766_06115 [Flavobacterium subsaxonicum WB 4.1-42 = DSM 21790]